MTEPTSRLGKFTTVQIVAICVLFIALILGVAYFLRRPAKESFDSSVPTLNTDMQPTSDMYEDPDPQSVSEAPIKAEEDNAASQTVSEPVASEQIGTNEIFRPLDPSENTNMTPADCYPKQKMLTAEELLPSECDNTWAQSNPVVPGSINQQNFLDAGYHIGLNTVGQSLRNANMQMRSEPPNPQIKVCPWNQSTIEPDIGRKGLEIGTGC